MLWYFFIMHNGPDNLDENALDRQRIRRDLDEILERVDSLPTIDPRRADEILNYDQNGLSS